MQEQQVTNKEIALLEENLAKANENVKIVGGGVNKIQSSLGKQLKTLIEGQSDLVTQTGKINRVSEVLAALKNQNQTTTIHLRTHMEQNPKAH